MEVLQLLKIILFVGNIDDVSEEVVDLTCTLHEVQLLTVEFKNDITSKFPGIDVTFRLNTKKFDDSY